MVYASLFCSAASPNGGSNVRGKVQCLDDCCWVAMYPENGGTLDVERVARCLYFYFLFFTAFFFFVCGYWSLVITILRAKLCAQDR